MTIEGAACTALELVRSTLACINSLVVVPIFRVSSRIAATDELGVVVLKVRERGGTP